MNKYKKSKIYKITSAQTDNIYIGSTTRTLNARLNQHKSHMKMYRSRKYHYVTSFEILQYNDAIIELIELYPCNSKVELLIREQHYLDNNPNRVNKARAYIPDKKEYKKLYQKTESYKTYNRGYQKEYLKKIHFCIYCGSSGKLSHIQDHNKTRKHTANVNYVNNLINNI